MNVVIKREASKQIEISLYECSDGTVDVLAKGPHCEIDVAILKITENGIWFFGCASPSGIRTTIERTDTVAYLGVKDFNEIDMSND